MRNLRDAIENHIEGNGTAEDVAHSSIPHAGFIHVISRNTDGRAVVTAIVLVSEWITSDMLRSVPVAEWERMANLEFPELEVKSLAPLERGTLTSDAFSRLVAQYYRAWSAVDPNPASAMAREYGVKLPTMHSWIREARLRKHLPPARGRRPRDEH